MLAVSGALVMSLLVLIFYASADKAAVRQWVNTVGFPGIWVAARLFQGAPLTRTIDVLFDAYLIACTAFEGFLVGLCIDFIRKNKKWSHII
jgi:hypothetical protein